MKTSFCAMIVQDVILKPSHSTAFTILSTQIVNTTREKLNSLPSGGEFAGGLQDLGNVLADFAESIWRVLNAEQS